MAMGEKKVSNRIDKWLWAVRIYKTRSLASEACKSGRVKIDDISVKPASKVEVGKVIKVRKKAIIYTYKVLAALEKRVSAKLAVEYVEDLTPEEEKLKARMIHSSAFHQIHSAKRERGMGRPTKKERRDIDKWKDFED